MNRGSAKRVSVLAYDDRWPLIFAREAEHLGALLPDAEASIHHIGSTSVPGLCAKPVIDILIGVDDLRAVDAATAEFEANGYRSKGEYGIRGRRYFSKEAMADVPKIHVHAFLRTCVAFAQHLAFRDHLRAHPEVAARYGELKRALASQHAEDAEAYQSGKAGFIVSVLDMWARRVVSSEPPASPSVRFPSPGGGSP